MYQVTVSSRHKIIEKKVFQSQSQALDYLDLMEDRYGEIYTVEMQDMSSFKKKDRRERFDKRQYAWSE